MNLEESLKECDNLYLDEEYEDLIKLCDRILEKYPDDYHAMGYKGISHLFFKGI